jgi:hypothetical protein
MDAATTTDNLAGTGTGHDNGNGNAAIVRVITPEEALRLMIAGWQVMPACKRVVELVKL